MWWLQLGSLTLYLDDFNAIRLREWGKMLYSIQLKGKMRRKKIDERCSSISHQLFSWSLVYTHVHHLKREVKSIDHIITVICSSSHFMIFEVIFLKLGWIHLHANVWKILTRSWLHQHATALDRKWPDLIISKLTGIVMPSFYFMIAIIYLFQLTVNKSNQWVW